MFDIVFGSISISITSLLTFLVWLSRNWVLVKKFGFTLNYQNIKLAKKYKKDLNNWIAITKMELKRAAKKIWNNDKRYILVQDMKKKVGDIVKSIADGKNT